MPTLVSHSACSWTLMWYLRAEPGQTQDLFTKSHRAVTMTWLFQVSADIVWQQGADRCRADTRRAPDLAKLGIPKVVCTNICTHCGICSSLGTRECLISHRRLSGLVHSYTFPPSISRNGMSAVVSTTALLAETELSLLAWVTVCGVPCHT